MAELRAYAALLAAQFRSVTSYRTSFVVELLTNIGGTALDVLSVLVLFRATKDLAGFSLRESMLIVGLSSAGFVLADFGLGSIERLKTHVRDGSMDTVLVRPLRAMPQLLLMDLPLRKALRLMLAIAFLVIAVRLNDVDWTPARAVLLVVTPVTGAVFFGSIFAISATLAFWWVDSGEIGNAFTYGGRDFTSYPIPVYAGWFRNVFAYGLGFAFVAYEPALSILNRPDPLRMPSWVGYLSPVVALVAALIAALVWRTGIRHYRSTGS